MTSLTDALLLELERGPRSRLELCFHTFRLGISTGRLRRDKIRRALQKLRRSGAIVYDRRAGVWRLNVKGSK